MPKILFISELWCDGDPSKGLTNNIHNLIGSFENSGCGTHDALFLDKCAIEEKKHIDVKIREELDNIKPDVVVCSPLGFSHLNPTVATFAYLKRLGIKIAIVFPDLIYEWGKQLLDYYNDLVDIFITFDYYAIVNKLNDKLFFCGVPQDERLYYPDEKKYDVCFLGSRVNRPVRQNLVNQLESLKRYYNVIVGGGQREEKLSHSEYARITRQSRIVLNSSDSPNGVTQPKGRIWEVLASRSILLEHENPLTEQILRNGIDYLSCTTQNFIDDVTHICETPQYDLVAKFGYETYLKRFSNKVYWSSVLDRLQI